MEFNLDSFLSKYHFLYREGSKSKKEFFEYVIPKLVEKASQGGEIKVVETGTMWTKPEEGAGAFTLIMADLIKNHTGGRLFTIDISPDAIEKCKANTLDYADHITYVTSDSINFLKNYSRSLMTDLFFLDSYDLDVNDPIPSQIHHLRELLAIYDYASQGVMIGVDDNFLPNTSIYWNWLDDQGNILSTQTVDTGNSIIGKGTLVDRFLLDNNWKKLQNLYVGESNLFLYEKPK
jgi:hypothetical protein